LANWPYEPPEDRETAYDYVMNVPRDPISPPAAVLDAFGLAQPHCEQITSGHINRTWRLQQTSRPDIPGDLILQRVNRIFHPDVQHNIIEVTAHLRSHGIATIELIQTTEADAFTILDGDVWRLMTYIEGTTIERISSSVQATQAARVLGEFHTALRSFTGTLIHTRSSVHDFSLHLQRLDMALLRHTDHRYYDSITALGTQIVETAAGVRDFPPTRNVLVHGDPKISNVIFHNGNAVCLIDLDTLTTLPLEIEIADAMRSWCNAESEDSPNARFSADLFAAALEGYRDLTPEIAQILPDATAKMAAELAARFCTDALEETYFGWNSQRYASASEHNQARCRAQLALAADILAQRGDLSQIALAAAK
jgi:Ser/Thr protein kinase RdoA (MazF antagonist)